MSDIFREVEEDVRKERLEKLWKGYGDYVIALVALIVLGVAGWQIWLRYESSQRDKAAVAFATAEKLATPVAAAGAFDSLAKTAPGGYAEISKLAEANALGASGKADDAVALYKDIANSDSGPVGATARLRAAWLLVDTTPRADLVTLLQPISGPSSGWDPMVREVLAYSDYKAGKTLAATAAFASLVNDPNTPDGLRSRARAFAAYLSAGGAANYGTVPPPAPPTAPGTPPGKIPANAVTTPAATP